MANPFGYWPLGYWPEEYWPEDFWQDLIPSGVPAVEGELVATSPIGSLRMRGVAIGELTVHAKIPSVRRLPRPMPVVGRFAVTSPVGSLHIKGEVAAIQARAVSPVGMLHAEGEYQMFSDEEMEEIVTLLLAVDF